MKRALLTLLISSFLIVGAGCQKESSPPKESTSKQMSAEVYFSPRGGCTDAVVKLINSSKKSVDVAIYSFTSKKIANALIDAHKRGVKVRVLIDYGNGQSKYCVGPLLEKAGIEVRYKKGSGGGLMHHKYAIYDGKVLSTGSFNWTGSAEKRNDENLVILRNAPELVDRYEENFKKLWRKAGLTN
jgi:phosphatidylserine/phosphatidylglycerophosphate/cardiolipin synthase-like enzyme